jgi:hypothetical protein
MLRITLLTPCSGQTLIRDGYRCVLTGRYGLNSAQNISDVGVLANASDQPPVVTMAIHIIPEFANADNEGGDKVCLLSSLLSLYTPVHD